MKEVKTVKYMTHDGETFDSKDEAALHEHIQFKLGGIDDFISAKQMDSGKQISDRSRSRIRNLLIAWEEYRFVNLGADDDKPRLESVS